MPRTDSLAWHIYRYAGLFRGDSLALDPTNRNIAINMSYPFFALGLAYEVSGDRERSERNLRRGLVLQPVPGVMESLNAGADVFRPPELADTPVGR